ncbi:MAG: hypothetical protein HZB26_00620 [Candidatus Hydrogenedentes bacterium]|nr:hypothetical protein [Candidatus Hydrogenedentota bacterium]
MRKKYIVEVAEVHYRLYSVVAENKKQAKALVNERTPEVVDCQTLEYSHELRQSMWNVQEDPEPETPSTCGETGP